MWLKAVSLCLSINWWSRRNSQLYEQKPSSMSNRSDWVCIRRQESKQYLKGHSCFTLPFSQEMPWFTFCSCQVWRNKVRKKKVKEWGSLDGQVNLLAHLWPTKHDQRIMYFPCYPIPQSLFFNKNKGTFNEQCSPNPDFTNKVSFIHRWHWVPPTL